MKIYYAIALILVLLSACSSTNPVLPPDTAVSNPPDDSSTDEPANTPPAQSYLPQDVDELMDRGNVYLESSQILILESYPVQIMLTLQGNLPTPCNHLRVDVQQPDEQNRIFVDVYSVSDPGAICAEVLEPFDTSIPLGSFPSGHYTVWVNDKQVGEFDS